MGGEVELTRFLLRPAPPFSKLAFILLLVPPGIQCFGLEQADLPSLALFSPCACAVSDEQAGKAGKQATAARGLSFTSLPMYDVCTVLYVYPSWICVCGCLCVCTVV